MGTVSAYDAFPGTRRENPPRTLSPGISEKGER